jgi:hypothetical protein
LDSTGSPDTPIYNSHPSHQHRLYEKLSNKSVISGSDKSKDIPTRLCLSMSRESIISLWLFADHPHPMLTNKPVHLAFWNGVFVGYFLHLSNNQPVMCWG